MKRTGFIRLFHAALVLVVVIGQAVPIGAVFAISIPSASSIMNDIENRYHLDASSIQDYGETLNVGMSKSYFPEVSIFFNPTSPREGQKIAAKAFPMYFSTDPEKMYYTWYLKRDGCDLGPVQRGKEYCDADGVGDVTVNDWKVTAARIIANDGADVAAFVSEADDNDGYRATCGGDNDAALSGKHQYIADLQSGTAYQLVTDSSSDSFSCGGDAACITPVESIDAGYLTSGTTDPSSTYRVTGNPDCYDDAPVCPSDSTPRCVRGSLSGGTFDYSDTSSLSCSSGDSSPLSSCLHLFAKNRLTGDRVGDGTFGTTEERFWWTNPSDPDTANNGKKDEANVVGFGADTFEWNYQSGDMLGVAVEGASMNPTKEADSSRMIMWAFSGGGCPVMKKGSYSNSIKGYSVDIPTSGMTEDDLNACLADNLIDPLSFGQANSKSLDVSVAATPDHPMNDPTGEGSGDIVTASVVVLNSERSDKEIFYEWKVEVADNISMAGSSDITDELLISGLISTSKGAGLSLLPITLGISGDMLGGLADKTNVYLRISAEAKENFGDIVSRKGKSDVIVRITNSGKRIDAYVADVEETDRTRVSYGEKICASDFHSNPSEKYEVTENLDRILCRVLDNEIIGVKVESDPGKTYTDIRWMLDGSPLYCGDTISSDCDGGVFFAISGSPGSTTTVRFDAVDVETGETVSLSRTFGVVEPTIVLKTADESILWPRFVRSYSDLDGNSFEEYSENFFDKYPSDGISMTAEFIPSFVGSISTRTWTIDGFEVPESSLFGIAHSFPDGSDSPDDIHRVSLSASIVQPIEKRRALRDIWGIEASGSAETFVGKSIETMTLYPDSVADSGPRKFYAALSGYVPPAVAFAVRAILSGGLLLFTIGFLFAFIPDRSR